MTKCPVGTHDLAIRHDPLVLNQIAECVPECLHPEDDNWIRRELTGLVLYACPCGYNSGWVSRETVPLAEEFLLEHLPPGMDREELLKAIGGGVE